MSSLGFIPDVAILGITFILIVLFRNKLANIFNMIPLPPFLVYLISSVPFMLIEENINCLPSGCVLIPWTIPFLLTFVLILGLIVKTLKPKTITYPLAGFIIFGALWEALIGGLSGQLQVIGPRFYVFMIFYAGLSYAYFIVVPLEIAINKKIIKK
ncbi:MAG: hypothetical protein ABIE22_05280 [archaeon]